MAPDLEYPVVKAMRTDIINLADQFRIMASTGRDLKEFCAPLGIDLEAVARPLQIDVSDLQQFDTRISLDRFCRLMEALAAIADDDAFGLKYEQYFKPGGTGAFGLGLGTAPRFKDALQFFAKYIHTLADLDEFNLAFATKGVTIEWTYSPLIARREQFVDYTAAAVMRVLRHCAGYRFEPLHAQLERGAPCDGTLHSEVFSRRIEFSRDINSVVIPAETLEIENAFADPVMFEYMTQKCEEALSGLSRKKDIVTLLKEDFIRGMMDNDRAIADVAKRLGMSERSLQRRLAELGTGFWEVYEHTRDELSMRLLQDTGLPLSEISRRVGYSSQSAYTRALKRWHGKSPRQLREMLKSRDR